MKDAVSNRRLILIGGPSGAGKTVLANALMSELGNAECARLAMDDYYADLAHLPAAERAHVNFDHPEAIDWPLLLSQVTSLLDGEPIQQPRYDFVSHTRLEETELLQPRQHLLLDGIHALGRDALVQEAALTVFVDADRDTCLVRRRQRDLSERGRDTRSIEEQFERTVWPMAETFVLGHRNKADVVADGLGTTAESVQRVLNRLRVGRE